MVVLLLPARSAEPPHSSGSTGARAVSTCAGGRPGGHALGVGRELGQGLGPSVGQLPGREPVEQRGAVGVGRPPRARSRGCHSSWSGPAPLADHAGCGRGRRPRPRRPPAGRNPRSAWWRDPPRIAEGGAVGLAGVLLGGGRPADDRPQHHQRRAPGFGLGRFDARRAARRRPRRSAPVDVQSTRLDVPAVGGVAGGDVLAERDVGVVLDGDVVLVVEDDRGCPARWWPASELASAVTPSIRSPSEATHVDVVVERALPGGASGSSSPALAPRRHGHAHGRCQALAERTGGDLDAAGVPVLGMARASSSPRCAAPEVLEFQAVAGQVELDVQA